jgi:hypothetical protein
MEKSYIELLAENDEEARKEFEPNAKELFVDHGEYDDVDAHQPEEREELEDQHEFQRYGGSHQQAAKLGDLEAHKSTHTTSISFYKSVKIHVISIDSRFRTTLKDNPSNFLFRLMSPIKNVVSIRLSSLEIPNTWYTFSEIRGNTTLLITVQDTGKSGLINITSGNYSLDTTLSNCLQNALTGELKNIFPDYTFTVVLNTISGLITISCTKVINTVVTPIQFSLDFRSGIFSSRNYNWGLGYNLGFRNENFTRDSTNKLIKKTAFKTSHTGYEIPDVLDSNYLFLSLNKDWKVVDHNQPDRTNTAAFAKIIVDVPKNDIIYDNGSNTITKTYNLKQPTNITAFTISVVDEYEQFVQLMGGFISLSLEVTEVLNSSLYESLRT